MLNAQYFGVPTRRRRVFLVAGLGQHPPIELLADAAPVGTFSGSTSPADYPAEVDGWAYPTLLSGSATSQINISGSGLIFAGEHRRKMVERIGEVENNGICRGLDEANFAETHAAGNAVVPQVAQWIAERLIKVS